LAEILFERRRGLPTRRSKLRRRNLDTPPLNSQSKDFEQLTGLGSDDDRSLPALKAGTPLPATMTTTERHA
jgi:hypothetical protein